MKRVTLLGLGTAVLVVAAAIPAAAQVKVAVIDVQRVVSESDAGKEALKQLAQLREQKQQEGQNLQKELDALRDQFAKQRFSLSEAMLAELNKQIEDKNIALQRFQDDATRELNDAQRKTLSALEDRIMPIINAVGKERGMTLIFNKFQSGLVYADTEVDITDEVIKRFNTTQ